MKWPWSKRRTKLKPVPMDFQDMVNLLEPFRVAKDESLERELRFIKRLAEENEVIEEGYWAIMGRYAESQEFSMTAKEAAAHYTEFLEIRARNK